MLYGMGDDDFEEPNYVRENRLNYKKVFLFILIIISLIFTIIIIFNIYKKNKLDQEQIAVTNSINNNEIIKEENNINKDIVVVKPENVKPVEEEIIDTTDRNNTILLHNVEDIQKQFLPKPNENAKQLIKDIYGSEEKQVYLTFDDGPSKHITPQVLDILKENNVKATFFVVGKYVDMHPEILKRAFNEGHYIANHSYTHEYSKIYESKDTTFDELRRCEESIKNALELPEYNTYLFRFPGGSSGGRYSKVKSEARDLLDSYGIAYTNWNCLTGDAAGSKTKEECIEQMIETKGNHNSIILLMHDSDNKTQTVEALPDIIQYFKDDGYVFKNFYEIFK